MLLCSLACLLLGALWNDTFPINKNLWTSSFVLWSGGWALLLYSSCFLLIDILGYKQWSLPFKLFGMNALFAFVAHVLLIKVLIAWKITSGNGGEISLKHLIMSNYFSQYSHQDAALFFSWFFLLVNFLLVIFLYQRKIFIRV